MEMMSSLAVGKHSVKFQCQNEWIALKDELPHNYTTVTILPARHLSQAFVFLERAVFFLLWNSSFPTSELAGVTSVKLATVSNELATGQNLLKDFERASSKVTGGTVDGRNPNHQLRYEFLPSFAMMYLGVGVQQNWSFLIPTSELSGLGTRSPSSIGNDHPTTLNRNFTKRQSVCVVAVASKLFQKKLCKKMIRFNCYLTPRLVLSHIWLVPLIFEP